MKTTFKKTLAAVSAAAVVAASAAVMAVPASAASTVSIGTTTISYDDLVAADGVVEVSVSAGSSSALAFGFALPEAVTYTDCSTAPQIWTVAEGSSFNWYAGSDSRSGRTCDPTLTLVVDIDAVDDYIDTASGVTDGNTLTLPITGVSTDANGKGGYVDDDTDVAVSDGAIVITWTAETTTTTTEAEEEETTTTTTATVTTSTGSPATGESSPLPIAGVVVAVAVIGGVAVVSKKRK